MRKLRKKRAKKDKLFFLPTLRCVEIDGEFCVFERKDGGWSETGITYTTCEECKKKTGTYRCFST